MNDEPLIDAIDRLLKAADVLAKSLVSGHERAEIRMLLDTKRAADLISAMVSRRLAQQPDAHNEDEPTVDEHRLRLMGDAVRRLLVKVGVMREDASATGPELLAAVDHYLQHTVSPEPASAWRHAAAALQLGATGAPLDQPTCPQCLGETDPFKIVMTTLCAKHLAEAEASAPSPSDIEKALEEGARDAKAVMDATPGLPGYFRASAPSAQPSARRCTTCGQSLEAVTYDRRIMRCPTCTSRGAPPPFVASLIERPDDSILCVLSKKFNGWVLPGDLMDKSDETIEDTQTRSLQTQTPYRSLDRTLIYEGTSDRGLYFFVYRSPVAGSSRRDMTTDQLMSIAWLTRAELLRISPLASFYRNLFVHIPATSHAPSYDAALDVAERWLAPRGPDPAKAASLAALLRQYAADHAAFMAETHRLDTIANLNRIGTLQRQCHQLDQSFQHALRHVSEAERAQRASGRHDEREDVLRFVASIAEQYQVDGWQNLADACRLLGGRIKEGKHAPAGKEPNP